MLISDEEKDKDSRTSLEQKVNDLIIQLVNIIETYPIVNPQPILKLINELREQVADVTAIEDKMNSIRREIISPVKTELQKSSKMGKFSIYPEFPVYCNEGGGVTPSLE